MLLQTICICFIIKITIPIQKIDANINILGIDTSKNNAYKYINDRNMRSTMYATNKSINIARNELLAAERLEKLNDEEILADEYTDLSNLSIKAKRLFSNYIIDDKGNYTLDSKGQRQLKSLRQKIMDIYYVAKNYNDLGVNTGVSEDNKGDVKNKETDTTVKGGIKSILKDMQKRMGAENFDLDKFLTDYADWADDYAAMRREYDNTFRELQELQVPEDTDKATWYSNVWVSMGGSPEKLGENVEINVVSNNADHGHLHGNYSNELSIEFNIPPISEDKINNFVELTSEQLHSDSWLNDQVKNKSVKIEKYINKDAVSSKLNEIKSAKDNLNITEHQSIKKNNNSEKKEDFNFDFLPISNPKPAKDDEDLKDIFKY